jgi:hypothetical protein
VADIGADPKVGGGIYNSGVMTVSYSSINNNSAPLVAFAGGGGGIYNIGGTVVLSNSTLSSNGTNNTGGAIQVDGGSVSLFNTTVSTNTATNGGGIFNGGLSGSGTLKISNSTLTANTATENAFAGGGGGISNYSGLATLINSTLYFNFANRDGAGLYNDSGGTSHLYNVTVAWNYADWNNDGVGAGGGIDRVGGAVNFRHTLIANNLNYNGCIVCNAADD